MRSRLGRACDTSNKFRDQSRIEGILASQLRRGILAFEWTKRRGRFGVKPDAPAPSKSLGSLGGDYGSKADTVSSTNPCRSTPESGHLRANDLRAGERAETDPEATEGVPSAMAPSRSDSVGFAGNARRLCSNFRLSPVPEKSRQ